MILIDNYWRLEEFVHRMTGCGGDSLLSTDLAPSGSSLGYEIGLAT